MSNYSASNNDKRLKKKENNSKKIQEFKGMEK